MQSKKSENIKQTTLNLQLKTQETLVTSRNSTLNMHNAEHLQHPSLYIPAAILFVPVYVNIKVFLGNACTNLFQSINKILVTDWPHLKETSTLIQQLLTFTNFVIQVLRATAQAY